MGSILESNFFDWHIWMTYLLFCKWLPSYHSTPANTRSRTRLFGFVVSRCVAIVLIPIEFLLSIGKWCVIATKRPPVSANSVCVEVKRAEGEVAKCKKRHKDILFDVSDLDICVCVCVCVTHTHTHSFATFVACVFWYIEWNIYRKVQYICTQWWWLQCLQSIVFVYCWAASMTQNHHYRRPSSSLLVLLLLVVLRHHCKLDCAISYRAMMMIIFAACLYGYRNLLWLGCLCNCVGSWATLLMWWIPPSYRCSPPFTSYYWCVFII